MRFPAGLLFGLVIVAIFLMLVRLEPELGYTGEQDKEALLQVFQIAEKMSVEANHGFQLHELLNQFRENLFSSSDSLFNDKKVPKFISDNFHDYDLAIAQTDLDANVSQIAQLNGEIDPELIREFIWFDITYVKKHSEDIYNNEKYSGRLAKVDKRLQRVVGNRGDKINLMRLRSSRMSTYRSSDKHVGLYWDHQRLDNDRKMYFFCRLDLNTLNKEMPFKQVLKRYNTSTSSCAFYDKQKGAFFQGPGYHRFIKSSALGSIKKYFLANKETVASEQKGSVLTILKDGSDVVVIGRELPGSAKIPVIIAGRSQIQNFSLAKSENVGVFAIACLGLLFFVQAVSFGRGPQLNVGKVLIIASMLAISMPFMMGRSIFKLILSETSQNEGFKLERELHSVLNGIDSGVRIFHANLYQNFLRVLHSDETVLGLKAAEKIQKAQAIAGTLGEIDTTGGAEVVLGISNKSFAPFEDEVIFNEDRNNRVNAVLILGPDNFSRFFDRFKAEVVGHVRSIETDSMYLLLNLYRMMLEPFFPDKELIPGLSTRQRHDREMEIERLKYEEAKDQISGTIGPDKFFELFSNFEGLNLMRTSIGITHFSVFPLYWRGLIHYFCGIGWDEFTISEMYLQNVFANLAAMQKSRDGSSANIRSLVSMLDPAFYLLKKPVFIQGFGGLRGDTIYSGAAESPRLGMLIKSAYRSKRPVKMRTEGDKSFLYQVNPGRFFSLYTMGASQETSHLKAIESWRSFIFMIGLALFLLIALFVAFNISRSFTGPLEHLLWGLSKVEKNDYSIKLKDSREDEFGSISRAFNFMIRRLREKDTLGKFVSESVRKLVGNPELFKQAQDGSEAEVTILFADLQGFAKFAAEADEDKVQSELEFSLGHFFKGAAEFGGEVDKVIGEKLLIIFPHKKLGKKDAARSAIKLMKKIIAAFNGRKNLQPVFGLNSGKVISGIIGTPAVRMDNTVIGDPVNVAARLCSLADSKTMPMIISGEIREVLGRSFRTRPIEIDKIRGKKQEVTVFSLEV